MAIEFGNKFQEVLFPSILDLLLLRSEIVVVAIVSVEECLIQRTDKPDVNIYFHIFVLEVLHNVVGEMNSMRIHNLAEQSMVLFLFSVLATIM